MIQFRNLKMSTVLWSRRVMFLTVLIGLFASIYLLIVYTSGAPIVCGLVHGCDVVRSSEWAHFYGIPRPALGVVFYAFMLGLLVVRMVMSRSSFGKWLNMLSRIVVLIGLVESIDLIYIQAVDIKAFCTWCLVSAAVTAVLFVATFFDADRALEKAWENRELKIQFFLLLAGVLVGTIAIWFLVYAPTTSSTGKLSGEIAMDVLVPAGTPVEGLATSTVTITEFIDFECPGCRAYAETLAQVRKDFGGKIRFAQRQFPLEEIHPHAKQGAIAAMCAAQQPEKYFSYADALIVNDATFQRADLIHYADALGLDVQKFTSCLDDPNTAVLVEKARQEAKDLGLNATPSLFLNDVQLQDLPNLADFEKAITQVLAQNSVK